MHASSDRGARVSLGTKGIGTRGAFALLVVLACVLAGCGSSGSADDGALPGAAASPTSAPAATAGPVVQVAAGGAPEVAGHPDATAALKAASLGCPPTLERDDPEVVSVFWRCSGKAAAATYDLARHRLLSLPDLLTGSATSYLTDLARTQFQADGLANADVGSILAWYLTPLSLVAIYPAGTIDYPISSLVPYLKRPSPLG